MTISIRKYYDTAAVETGGGGETAVEKEAPQFTSISEAMAKAGTKTNGLETPDLKQVEIKKEVTEKPKEEKQPTSAETATKVEKPTEEKAETTEKKPEVKKEEVKVEAKKEETAKPQPTFEEVLKSQPKNAVLKALGLNDKTISLLNEAGELDEKTIGLLLSHKEGKEAEYLRELTTDYTKMTSEDVMRHQLRLDYPKANSKQLEALFNKEVVKQYNLDSDDDEEKETGQMLLDAKADRYRDEFITKQKDFIVPKYEAKKPEAPVKSEQDVQDEKDFENYKGVVNNSQLVKDIIASKTFTLGDGEEKFTYAVENPEEISKILFDDNEWLQAINEVELDDKGMVSKVIAPKTEHQLLIAMVAKYGKPFLDAYAGHFKSLGGKKVVDTLENAKKPDSSTDTKAEKQPSNPAEHMAKSGRLNPGGQG